MVWQSKAIIDSDGTYQQIVPVCLNAVTQKNAEPSDSAF
jgi:hypothetical protein